MKIIISFFTVCIILSCKCFSNGDYLLKIEQDSYSFWVKKTNKSKQIIRVYFIAKADILIPHYKHAKKNQLFFVRKCIIIQSNKSCPKIFLGWDMDDDIHYLRDELEFKVLKKNEKIVQIIDLSSISGISSIDFNISYLNESDYSKDKGIIALYLIMRWASYRIYYE